MATAVGVVASKGLTCDAAFPEDLAATGAGASVVATASSIIELKASPSDSAAALTTAATGGAAFATGATDLAATFAGASAPDFAAGFVSGFAAELFGDDAGVSTPRKLEIKELVPSSSEPAADAMAARACGAVGSETLDVPDCATFKSPAEAGPFVGTPSANRPLMDSVRPVRSTCVAPCSLQSPIIT